MARYRRGGPLSPRRLLACDGQRVVFRYEERAKGPGGQAKPGTMRLPLDQFIGRFLRPVPPPHAVRVRCWGLYAHAQGAALAQCRQPLGQGPSETPAPLDEPHARQGWGAAAPECCPVRAFHPPPKRGGRRWQEGEWGRPPLMPVTGAACGRARRRGPPSNLHSERSATVYRCAGSPTRC